MYNYFNFKRRKRQCLCFTDGYETRIAAFSSSTEDMVMHVSDKSHHAQSSAEGLLLVKPHRWSHVFSELLKQKVSHELRISIVYFSE